jgi:hypothetical protein
VCSVFRESSPLLPTVSRFKSLTLSSCINCWPHSTDNLFYPFKALFSFIHKYIWLARYALRFTAIFLRPLVSLGSTWFVVNGIFLALYTHFDVQFSGIELDNAGEASIVRWGMVDILSLTLAGIPSFVTYVFTRSKAVYESISIKDKRLYEKLIGMDQNDGFLDLNKRIFHALLNIFNKTVESEELPNEIPLNLLAAIFFIRMMNAISSALGVIKILAEFAIITGGESNGPILCAFPWWITCLVGFSGALIAYYPFDDFIIATIKRNFFIIQSIDPNFLPKETFRDQIIKTTMEISYYYSFSNLVRDCLLCVGKSENFAITVGTIVPLISIFLGPIATKWGRVAGKRIKNANSDEVNTQKNVYDLKLNIAMQITKVYEKGEISDTDYDNFCKSGIFYCDRQYSSVEELRGEIANFVNECRIERDWVVSLLGQFEQLTLEAPVENGRGEHILSCMMALPILMIALDAVQSNLSIVVTTWYFLQDSLLVLPGLYWHVWKDFFSDSTVQLTTASICLTIGVLAMINSAEANLTMGTIQAYQSARGMMKSVFNRCCLFGQARSLPILAPQKYGSINNTGSGNNAGFETARLTMSYEAFA